MHIVHTEASCGWGGQELRILEESRGMIARGHRLSLLCPRESRIHDEALARGGIDVHALPIGRKTLPGVLAMRRWLAANACDVINTHSSTDSWLAALACQTLRAAPPIVRTRHISAPVNDSAGTRWLYVQATRHIVTTGERLRRTLIDHNRFPAGHITSVPTGIDTRRFAPGDRSAARASLGLPQTALIIGIVATLRSWKGHKYLLDAFASLARTNTMLLVVGDGPQREALEAQARTLPAADIRFVGNQDPVASWLQAMDLFVLPSYANEGVPQSLMQAMLCGLPVISTPVGSILELVDDGRTGLIVPPQDAPALASAMSRLLDDPDLRTRLGGEANRFASAHYGMEGMLDRMEAIFEKVRA